MTSDSLLHIYHIQFDETLREIEERFYDDLWTLTEEMLVRAEASSEASLRPGEGSGREERRLLLGGIEPPRAPGRSALLRRHPGLRRRAL